MRREEVSPGGKTAESVAVVVPIHRPLSGDEEHSIDHLHRFLAGHRLVAALPDGLRLELPGFAEKRFDPRHFESRDAYSRLLLSGEFYAAFLDCDYILIYQPDCLVFSSDLESWCRLGYDYIGAPLLRDPSDPSKGFSRAGNGGLSLRRVKSFLRVLSSKRYTREKVSFAKELFHKSPPDLESYPLISRWRKKTQILKEVRRGAQWYTQHYSLNEDLFWSDRARFFDPEFKVAPVDVALKFAFEREPRMCYELNGRQLPFGCHAWAKWDREFWKSECSLMHFF